MDFPDPESKRARTIKLFTGYGLVALGIGLATLILVYVAQGYRYNPDGGVTQSGLVFVGANPVQARIWIDNEEHGKTESRFVLNEGKHDIKLTRDKYRDWSKTIALDGGGVQYVLYPRLFPVDIPVSVTQVYATAPSWVSQSPDRRWIIFQQPGETASMTVLDTSKKGEELVVATLPFAITGTLSPIEWSTDNRHILLRQAFSDGSTQYIVFDRENTDQSVNVTQKIQLSSAVDVTLRDKKYDQFYVFDRSAGTVQTASLSAGLTPAAVATGVVQFKPYAADTLLYVTYQSITDTSLAAVRILNGSSVYTLQPIARDPTNRYLLDAAKFDGDWYAVTASGSADQVKIYRNPMSRSKSGNVTPIMPQMSLRLTNPQYVSFSDNARFIAMQSGRNFVVFDGELNRIYRFTSALDLPVAYEASWMDGHRFSVVSGTKAYVFEFDGANQQELATSIPQTTMYFDRDYETGLTFASQADGKVGLRRSTLVVD